MADLEWIAESLVQFARSPLWTAPVQNYVDDKCGVFNTDAEMKLEYTVIHREFCALVDRLLTCFLDELGVAPQQAIDALQQCAAPTQANDKLRTSASRLLKYMYSVDDFVCFHRLMVKRNVELDIAAYAELQRQGVVAADPAATSHTSVPDETSADGAVSERLVRDTNGEMDENEALRLAIEASLHDKVMAEKRLALEEAQLQEALAMNACAEQRQTQQGTDSVPHETHKVESKALYSQSPTRTQASEVAQEAAAAEQPRQQQRAQHAVEHALCAHVPEAQRTITTELTEAPRAEQQQQQQRVNTVTAAAPSDAPASRPQAMAQPARPAGQLGLRALPPISAAAAPVSAALPPPPGNARPAAAAPHGTTAATAAKPTAAAKPPTKEELEARARHMREQRERIITQNKASRQQTLQEYASNNNVALPKSTEGQEAAERKLTIDIARRLREDILDEVRRQ